MPGLHIVVMGVSGSGKTTLAQDLAQRTGWAVLEADELHPGTFMNQYEEQEEQIVWIDRIAEWMKARAQQGENTVVACTALTRTDREKLNNTPGTVFYVHLYGTIDIVLERSPQNLPKELLEQQLAALQRLHTDELGIQLDVTRPHAERVEAALAAALFAQKSYNT